MLREVKYDQYSKELLQQLPKGAFINVKDNGKINTMTIGWGNIGFIWGKPIFTVLVRYSRYTYELMQNTDEFTISIPLNGQLKKELGFCGSKSGRDIDKIKECKLNILNGKKVNSPMIEQCDLHYECKVVYKQAMEPALIDPKIKDNYYNNNDYHVLYYAEIVGTYIKEQ